MAQKPNVVIVILDTQRLDYLGCYGNGNIRTPHIDAFARRALRFTRAFPESLPTIPFRRALHTGRRAFPFRNYRPPKWSPVRIVGWQPLSDEEDTLAENLAAAGYQTGFVADTFPYFAPGFNFYRGFWQWEYIRGQQQDRWRSPYVVSREQLSRYGDPDTLMRKPHSIVPMHLANTAHIKDESETTTARVFRWGMQFIEENRAGQPFYLLMDSFKPHEPWEAPEDYHRLYGDPNYKGLRIIHPYYGPTREFGYTDEEVAEIRAQYSGLVTLVDTWFGKFMQKLDDLGLAENTAVILMSDHGTNLCDNPRGIIGKPEESMYPGVMRLPLLVRLPGDLRGGETCDEFVNNTDLAATVYDLASVDKHDPIDGQSLLPLLRRGEGWKSREYVTCRYGHSLSYIDKKYWLLTDLDWQPREAFDLESDPDCQKDIGAANLKELFTLAWQRILQDAQGELPPYRHIRRLTDALGRDLDEIRRTKNVF